MKINLNNLSITNYANKRKKQISEDKLFKVTDNINSSKSDLNTPGKRKIEYILEGGMIKVYVSDGKNPPKCIKSVPVESAPKELLAKVKCINIADALYLNDLMRAKDESNNDLLKCKDESNKEVVEKTSDKDINENDSTNKNEISNNFSLFANFEDNYIFDDEEYDKFK
ncbi:hypothetical protein [Clostridium sp. UBA7503]|uniref:hypothetical protein n=1 Tax=Clostridium sp. UBA7503 TaxID=1946377 RepID=UPI00321695EF